MPENPHEHKKKPPIGLISGFSCLVETEGLDRRKHQGDNPHLPPQFVGYRIDFIFADTLFTRRAFAYKCAPLTDHCTQMRLRDPSRFGIAFNSVGNFNIVINRKNSKLYNVPKSIKCMETP